MSKLKENTSNYYNKCYIIAELSANHNNDFKLAKSTIAAMKEAGADAVKFQTYTADSLSLNINNEIFGPRKDGLWKGWRPYDLYKEASMPYEWQPKLAEYASSLGLEWLSSPFDFDAVDFLESINCPIYKIASFEIVDIPLIEYVASKNKPIIISTGIATLTDIELAIKTCKKVGNENITLLKCTSAYPSPYEEINLKTIPHMGKAFGLPVGLSDHTLGIEVAIGAVALGGKVVEKHFILDRKLEGPDSAFSMEPAEFKQMVTGIRNIEKALGSVNYNLTDSTIGARERGRSLFVVKDIKKGDIFSKENIRSIRPGIGLPPKYYYKLLGRKATVNIKKGTPLNWDLIQ
jgi:pseudaminic acid synthase